jgi:hypothetical protein
MGEAVLAREFKVEPPREPLTSLPALWRDYVWRYVARERTDHCMRWVKKASDLKLAIVRAVDSRGEDGKMFFHQSKVRQPCRDELARRLLKDRARIQNAINRDDFDRLYDLVRKHGEAIHGIGSVTIYDVTTRLATWGGVEPDNLYIHAGVIPGARALGIELPEGQRFLPRDELPLFFRNKDLDKVESFLCGYRSELIRIMEGDDAS